MVDEYNPSKWRGFYAPFRIPFHVEDVPSWAIDDEPLVYLCFNEEARPYIDGALKALASELSWEGPKSCVATWVTQFTEILLKEPCDCNTDYGRVHVNWYPLFTTAGGGSVDYQLVTDGNPDYRRCYVMSCSAPPIGDLDVTVHFQDDATDTDCGGNVAQMKITSLPLADFGEYDIYVTDCFDTVTHIHVAQNDYDLTPGEYKSIRFFSSDSAYLSIGFQIRGEYTCIES